MFIIYTGVYILPKFQNFPPPLPHFEILPKKFEILPKKIEILPKK